MLIFRAQNRKLSVLRPVKRMLSNTILTGFHVLVDFAFGMRKGKTF